LKTWFGGLDKKNNAESSL